MTMHATTEAAPTSDLHFAFGQASIGVLANARGKDVPDLSVDGDGDLGTLIRGHWSEQDHPLLWSIADIAGSKAWSDVDGHTKMLDRTLRDLRRQYGDAVVQEAEGWVEWFWPAIHLIGSRLVEQHSVNASAVRSLLAAYSPRPTTH